MQLQVNVTEFITIVLDAMTKIDVVQAEKEGYKRVLHSVRLRLCGGFHSFQR